MNRFADKKVVVIGAARQGQALARFFCKRGAEVVVSDMRSEEKLADDLTVLRSLPVKLYLTDTNQGRPHLHWLVQQRQRSVHPWHHTDAGHHSICALESAAIHHHLHRWRLSQKSNRKQWTLCTAQP